MDWMHEQGAAVVRGVEWLEGHLSSCGLTADEVLRRERQRQAANQVSIGNCVTSLRLLSALDWTAFFERTSLVEAVLREDPAGVYAGQDFATRDRYRQAVEKLSRGSRDGRGRGRAARPSRWPTAATGVQTADGARAARTTSASTCRPRAARSWKACSATGPAARPRAPTSSSGIPRFVYFGGVAAVTVLVLAVVLVGAVGPWAVARRGCSPSWPCSLVLPPASDWRCRWSTTGSAGSCRRACCPSGLQGRDPGRLRRLRRHAQHADAARSARPLLERLEIHYLSNPDPNLRFALLTDFADAPHGTHAGGRGHAPATPSRASAP